MFLFSPSHGEVTVLSPVCSTYHDSLELQQLIVGIKVSDFEKTVCYHRHAGRESPLVMLVSVPNLLKAVWVVWSFHGVF